MKKTILIVACAVMALILSSPCHAEEPYIEITNSYTTDLNDELCNAFGVWEPVFYYIEYSIYGNPSKLYKVIGILRALGAKTELKEKHYPGDYTMMSTRMVTDELEPGLATGTYKVKLKKAGELQDIDAVSLEVSIEE